jgi:hypothetical protein
VPAPCGCQKLCSPHATADTRIARQDRQRAARSPLGGR